MVQGGEQTVGQSLQGAGRLLRAYPRTGGDCPGFAQSAEQNGTVPLSEAVLG